MSRHRQNGILDIRSSLITGILFDVLHDHSDHLLEGYTVISIHVEAVSSVLEFIALDRCFMVKRFYQFVQIEVCVLRFFLTLHKGIVFEMPNAIQKGNLHNNISTPLWLFLPDLEFSTMMRFLPGEIKAAFQNSVPKSMPMTWGETTRKRTSKLTSAKLFMDLIYIFTRIIWTPNYTYDVSLHLTPIMYSLSHQNKKSRLNKMF